MSVLLTRLRNTTDGMFGNFTFNGRQVAVILEPPWNNNKPLKSCIPPGTFTCLSHKKGWELIDVPDRLGIFIRSGNSVKDTDGDILVGRRFDSIAGISCVTMSKLTLEQLRSLLPSSFTLTITDPH